MGMNERQTCNLNQSLSETLVLLTKTTKKLLFEGVGKSSLLKQFVEQKFLDDYQITIGVEFNSKTIQIGDDIIKLQIWDTTGQENFKSVTRLYYRASAGAIMVYDITKRETFQNVLNWFEEAKTNGNPYMKFLLVGNKCDLELRQKRITNYFLKRREVSYEEGRNLAYSQGINFIETSAKIGNNVEDSFLRLSYEIYEQCTSKDFEIDQRYGVKILKDQENQRKQSFVASNADNSILIENNQNLNQSQNFKIENQKSNRQKDDTSQKSKQAIGTPKAPGFHLLKNPNNQTQQTQQEVYSSINDADIQEYFRSKKQDNQQKAICNCCQT